MDITITTRYTYNLIKAFSRFQVFKGRYSRIMAGVFPSFLAFVFGGTLYNLIAGDFFALDLLLLLSAGSAFCAYMISFFYYPRSVYKKHIAFFGETVNRFYFSEDIMVVRAVSDRYSGKSEIRYRDLKTVYETKDYLYLYLNSLQAFVICREEIDDEETFETVRTLLRQALGTKHYILCH